MQSCLWCPIVELKNKLFPIVVESWKQHQPFCQDISFYYYMSDIGEKPTRLCQFLWIQRLGFIGCLTKEINYKNKLKSKTCLRLIYTLCLHVAQSSFLIENRPTVRQSTYVHIIIGKPFHQWKTSCYTILPYRELVTRVMCISEKHKWKT